MPKATHPVTGLFHRNCLGQRKRRQIHHREVSWNVLLSSRWDRQFYRKSQVPWFKRTFNQNQLGMKHKWAVWNELLFLRWNPHKNRPEVAWGGPLCHPCRLPHYQNDTLTRISNSVNEILTGTEKKQPKTNHCSTDAITRICRGKRRFENSIRNPIHATNVRTK